MQPDFKAMQLAIVAREERVRMPRSLRRTFKAFATEAFVWGFKGEDRNLLRFILDDFNIHHIIPRNMGGSNAFNNLTLCEPKLHRDIHHYLRNEFACSMVGQPRDIHLPMLPGNVWGLTADVVCNSQRLRPEERRRVTDMLTLERN